MVAPVSIERPTARLEPLIRAAHPGPTAVVTLVAAVLAIGAGLTPARVALVTAAVLTGQLSIGWSNDLIDARRDRVAGRTDKPLATGALDEAAVRNAAAAALVATVVLSLACGWLAGAVHLVVVASGWAYNLGLKSTVWSWVPYAAAFGALPVFVVLAGGGTPTPAVAIAGALLGVGAHLVNVLPDLDDDARTGVRGLPHRLDPRWLAPMGMGLYASASVLLVLTTPSLSTPLVVTALAATATLVGVGLFGRGRTPFRAAMALALVDVLLLAGAL